ncbi:hypothetical protein PhCBS80983_g02622 [Powellomyces hirtus]|uniref:YABBY protein C-terminal domain-containing protein n=1 Tax=Powellomyces hirtus TaxID=109895 RepID=A0A507E7B4_9FUNG|nr:hypothetical protein DFJ77DRAFT_478811 [Powellomyces hirtus]TPX59267.1 hypothetical protein PhCBS80983_g02622 [Powellomyces hirtus]
MPKAATPKSDKPAAKKTAGGSKRGASPYNQFMKTELVKVKADNPDIAHKDAFRLAASHWKHAPENPNKVPK